MAKYKIVTKPAYRAVGLKWEGTFQEVVPGLKNVIADMKSRVNELGEVKNPDVQLGLSYHVIENGFVHYSAFEVAYDQEVPLGMVDIHVPEWTYLHTTHQKGEDIVRTYTDLHNWLHESDYQALKEDGVTYYDPYMPIKHEHYPIDQDPDDPHFEIYIPVVKKS